MADWFAIRAKPGAEGRALITIGGIGLTGYLPVEIIRIRHRDGYEISWRPLFQNYLFVKLAPERDIPRVLEIEGVAEILHAAGHPAPIRGEVIEALRIAEQAGAFDRARARLVEGDQVRLPSGPFAHLIARIRSTTARRRAELIGDFVFRVTAPVDRLVKVGA